MTYLVTPYFELKRDRMRSINLKKFRDGFLKPLVNTCYEEK